MRVGARIENKREAMTGLDRTITAWKLRTRTLELGRRTLVCGVVNITPDSFSDGGRFLDPQAAIGGTEGSAAGAAISSKEEQARLLPVLKGILAARPETIVSVDTYKATTARAAVAAGAEIVNDVSGFFWDPEMAGVCAEAGCGVVLMHTRGRPEEWKAQPQLAPNDVLATVRAGLEASLKRAAQAGIATERIVLDPGYGFGKKFDENFALLARQGELLALGRPLLAGVSRKSFLGRALASLFDGKDAPVDARETASLAAMVAAILHGASVVRVHAVRPAAEAALVADAVANRDQGSGALRR